jgi:hypothetical protein
MSADEKDIDAEENMFGENDIDNSVICISNVAQNVGSVINCIVNDDVPGACSVFNNNNQSSVNKSVCVGVVANSESKFNFCLSMGYGWYYY